MKQFFFILLFCPIILLAQPAPDPGPKGSISGTVLDKDLQEAIPYATIILNDKNGNLVTGSITDESGNFNIPNVQAGAYVFIVQFMGYQSHKEDLLITKDNANLNLGNILLNSEVAELDDVVITAEITTIQQKIDRKVINVGKDLTTTGATAMEIMNNIPSLNVDQDGNLALRGNQNVRILVDGKPSNLDAAQLLKQIPSTSIKAIELITNPSAKYNPEGMSGIINIVLHKNSNLGFNGNVSGGITQGENTRGNGSLNLNYRKNKFNFYSNLGANTGTSYNKGTLRNFDANSLQQFSFLNKPEGFLVKAGVDYYLDDKNTISFYTNQNFFDNEFEGYMDITYTDSQPDILQNFVSLEDGFSSNYNFHYKRDLEKEGHSITLEADYGISDNDERSFYDYETANPFFTAYHDRVLQNRSLALINLDYVNPLSESMKLELGAEGRFRRTENSFTSNNENLQNSAYNYDRNIFSTYATLGQNFEKWSYQGGLRMESYSVEAILNSEKIYEDDYLTLYPSAFITYSPTEKNQFQVSYSRRVDRPGLNQVNPIREFATPRLTSVGNPELDPQFTNSMELNYTRRLGKGSLTSGVFYRLTNNRIARVILEDEENPENQILTFINSDDAASAGFEISANYKPLNFWDFNANFSYYNNSVSGIISGEEVEQRTSFVTFRMNNNFKATKQLTFQLFGMYRGPLQDLQMKVEEMYFVNAGARYSFLQDKATLSLNFNDIFNTQESRISSTEPLQTGVFKNESQTIYVGLSYRFGGGKNQALKRKQRDTDNQGNGGGLF